MDWEKIPANDISGKRLWSRINKELLQLKKKGPNLKWAKDLNRYFSKEDIQMSTVTWKGP